MAWENRIKGFAKKVIPKRYHFFIMSKILEPLKSRCCLIYTDSVENVPEVGSCDLPVFHVEDIMKEIQTRLDYLKNSNSN